LKELELSKKKNPKRIFYKIEFFPVLTDMRKYIKNPQGFEELPGV